MNATVADRRVQGRVMLYGDAANQFPPPAGLEVSTGLQDMHNAMWITPALGMASGRSRSSRPPARGRKSRRRAGGSTRDWWARDAVGDDAQGFASPYRSSSTQDNSRSGEAVQGALGHCRRSQALTLFLLGEFRTAPSRFLPAPGL